ncbi:helix-turn-helix domain-containing protein [Paenibacillus sabinae]|uniref:helix-turn-helix domain-containing protein n=1 Tax=Paenibacillus sabinae TaxID=365617 RepID=UPI0011868AB3|nr:helix-turn-helix domain-containing protein [Paenibacillus sabinae]
MNKNSIWIFLLSVILLCGTLIVCTSIYAKDEKNSSPSLSDASDYSISQNTVLSLNEAADYLRISTDDLKTIIKQDEEKRTSRGPTNAYDLIPYVNLNGNLIFYRPSLDKWIEYNTLNK